MNYEEELSDLVWMGRRLDKALRFIKDNQPQFVDDFLNLVSLTFERIILENLYIDEEDYLFEGLDESLDNLEEIFGVIFENKTK
jgi:hypothetical protein